MLHHKASNNDDAVIKLATDCNYTGVAKFVIDALPGDATVKCYPGEFATSTGAVTGI